MPKSKKSKKQRVVVTDLPPASSVARSRQSLRERIFHITALVVAVIVIAGFGIERYYDGRALPGVSVGITSVGGMDRKEVVAAIEEHVSILDNEGLPVQGRGRTVSVTPTVRSARIGSIDTSYDLIRFDVDATADNALAVGRGGNILGRWLERFAALTYGASVPVHVDANRDGLEQFLRDNFGDLEHPAQDARAVFDGETTLIVPEKSGEVFDYAKAADDIVRHVEQGDYEEVVLHVVRDEPRITEQDFVTVWPILQRARGNSMRTFVFSEAEKLQGVIDFEPLLTVRRTGGVVEVGLDQKLFEAWLTSEVRPTIDVAVQEPKFEIKDGKVVAFHGGQSGKSVNAEETRLLWEQQLLEEDSAPLTLIVDRIEPKQKVSDINDLGIEELVAEAWTDFRGSPPNRIHNIRRGAALLDGVLVPPGEEFSTIKALSPITTANGFLPELVIKGDRTKPEVGGGLCQVSTTAFRVALNAGMPITSRANHSYRVPYYEPPIGMDATIYDPAPDFKFLNDSPHHLLLKTRVEGTRLIYQLWGTKDGRNVQMSEPKVWGIVAPEETEIIETEDLPPGEKKCVERAHVGSKASFTYIVKYADDTEKKKEFVSTYKPWRAVCLIGKDPNAPTDPENQNPPPEGEGR